MRDRVSHPFETTGEIAVLYVLMFEILGNKGSATLKGKAIPLQSLTGPKISRRLRLPDF
jgi:hypothetical protein